MERLFRKCLGRGRGRKRASSSHGTAQTSLIILPPEKPSSQCSTLPEYPKHRSPSENVLKVATDVRPGDGRVPSLSSVQPELFSSDQWQGQRTHDRRDEPLGLLVLHTPPNRTIDILFIHGLGGTSLSTWCYNRDLRNLWPKLWLPDVFPTARVLTFGYNAHLRAKQDKTSSTIRDFASSLLFHMKYGENTAEKLGQVPIVVVAHSMGGLVIKQAVVQGHSDSEFSHIVSMINAVVFLATPHRGTDLAETLNKLGLTPKIYVAELARRSPTIDELNDTFRHHVSKLRLVSFYETRGTAVGPISLLVVEKQTAVLGYPGEVSAPLDADHHNVCKFTSKSDPNYLSVVRALRDVIESIENSEYDKTSKDDLRHIADFLGVSGAPEEDLAFASAWRKEGTCEGFLEAEEVINWRRSETNRILWAHAPPGAGKSTTCSFVIENFLEAGLHCSYFFFRHGQRGKHSPSNMLLSLAFQTALQLPAYRRALADRAKSGPQISNAGCETIWEKLFMALLAPIRTGKKIFWIVDGLDESDTGHQGIKVLSRIANFNPQIRILIFSRPLASIKQMFQGAREKIHVTDMVLPDNREDIRLMVAGEVEYLVASDDFKAWTIDEITSRSHGNFLWASLVTKRVVKCLREEQIRRILSTTPNDMDQLYDRMMDSIFSLEFDEDKSLSKVLLTWAMYATSPVTVEELSEVYPEELGSVININLAVSRVCGQFVVLDPQHRVTLVHHSAREYLQKTKRRPFALDPTTSNEELFDKCLVTLCDKELTRKLHELEVPRFLPYASTSWAAHLEGSSPDSEHIRDTLAKFFGSPSPLAWVHYLAMSGRLSELFLVSRTLAVYVQRSGRSGSQQFLTLIKKWALDLTKLPAKFGRHLSEQPTAIYHFVPALCPTSSIIHQMFDDNPATTLTVSGLSNDGWDDCLARISVDTTASSCLASSKSYLAVSSELSEGSLTIWDTNLFQEIETFVLGDCIYAMTFNSSGSLFACSTSSETRVWRVPNWSLELCISNPIQEGPFKLQFDERDTLFWISENGGVQKLLVRERKPSPLWEQLNLTSLVGLKFPEGADLLMRAPNNVAFNSDCTRVALAYEFPDLYISIWSVDPPKMVSDLFISTKEFYRLKGPEFAMSVKVVWRPFSADIIATRPRHGGSGDIFKWNPVDDTYQEVERGTVSSRPCSISCSPNGKSVAAVDWSGTIRIYELSTMSLVYRLATREYIGQIYFSADSIRFYTLSGQECSIWEPGCLFQLANEAPEQTGSADSAVNNPNTSVSLLASEPRIKIRPPAVRQLQLANAFNGRPMMVAIAHADGSISIRDAFGRMKYKMDTDRFATLRLALTPEGDRLAYAFYGTVVVKSVCLDNADGSVSTETLYSWLRAGATSQLLFDDTGKRLLIMGGRRLRVVSLPDGIVLAERLPHDEIHPDRSIWQRHPSDPDHLLCFTFHSVFVFSWDSLDQKTSISLDLFDSVTAEFRHLNPNGFSDDIRLHAILHSYCPDFLLLRIFYVRDDLQGYRFVVLPTQHIYSPVSTERDPGIVVRPLALPPSLTSAIMYGIGILPDGRLVFIDHNMWICTTTLSVWSLSQSSVSGAAADVVRQYFVPYDWVTPRQLLLCGLLRDGALLCPTSDGGLAVMRGKESVAGVNGVNGG